MPSRELLLWVQDRLTEIAVVEEAIAGCSVEVFAQNRQALRAVLYSLAVIGEAVASVTDELAVLAPEIPWQQIRGLRNVVIHEYFRVDVETVWQTTQSDLPRLKNVLQNIVQGLDHEPPPA